MRQRQALPVPPSLEACYPRPLKRRRLQNNADFGCLFAIRKVNGEAARDPRRER
jgi:hypothetical protein